MSDIYQAMDKPSIVLSSKVTEQVSSVEQRSSTLSPSPLSIVQQLKSGSEIQRQQSILALQKAIGNQATLQLLEENSDDIHQAAAIGVAGPGTKLPHFSSIQESFGAHDISGVQFHSGSKAAMASAAIGAQAYTTSNHVASARPNPGLHTEAHEAAHYIQQQQGVQLSGGLGQVGDKYEKHADAVADKVVKGESAEPLLSKFSGAEPSIQKKEAEGAMEQSQLVQKMTDDEEMY
ncbi:MAG: DUF4157 domain-containing protein [Pseudomonadales bacterium]